MSHIGRDNMKKIGMLTIIFSIIVAGMFSGCVEKTDQRIIFESLRDAPLSPDDPNYQDFLDNMHKYLELYTMNIDGYDIQRITNNKYYESQADISPDGTKIVCSIHYSPEGTMNGIEPGWEIAIMDIDGKNITNLTNNTWIDTGAHWNHDGTKIVYLSDTAHRTLEDVAPENYTQIQLDVYTMDADGNNVAQLTFAEPGEIYADPSFSFAAPSKILYIHDDDGEPPQNYDLYMMDANGNNKELILRHDDQDLQAIAINDPMFSPDGITIIFEAKMGEDEWGHEIYHIFTIDASGENLTKITQGDEVSEGMQQFSPDGTKMTFDRVIWNNATDGIRKIWLANADGSEEKCLSSFRYEGCASWFPIIVSLD
jgi:Tol biopolymer transport system component